MLRVIAVVGATATGKSGLALGLAEALGAAEIVNADAMQFYRGMDIGTAKLSIGERRGVPHHQLDVLDPSEEASVAAYQREARADVEGIAGRGAAPIAVGGSGLYVRALLDELEFPGTDPAVRAAIEAQREEIGAAGLHRLLAEKDPVAAATIDAANTRRVVRALEVIELTGKPFTANLPTGEYHWPTIQFGLRGPNEWLDERIETRARQMIADGLLKEVAGLGALGPTASRATGYSQALDCLAGRLPEEELASAIALATRQLSRRQIKWFRRDSRIHWLDATDPAAALAEALAVLASAPVDP